MSKQDRVVHHAVAINYLRNDYGITPDTRLYLVIRHVVRLGSATDISVHLWQPGGISTVTHIVAKALGWRYNPNTRGVRVQVGGMGAEVELAHVLYRTLFGNRLNAKGGGMLDYVLL